MNAPACPNGCAACCDPVQLPFTKRQLMSIASAQGDRTTIKWVTEALTPMPLREAKAKAPHLFTGRPMADANGKPVDVPLFYRCANLDHETRRCTVYDDRPQWCSGYPRYDEPVTPPHAALPETCAYRAEQGLPVRPVPVELRPKG